LVLVLVLEISRREKGVCWWSGSVIGTMGVQSSPDHLSSEVALDLISVIRAQRGDLGG
jgi:hypothetical protein